MSRKLILSEIEWIGLMPKMWEISTVGKEFINRNTKVNDVDFSPLSVTKTSEGVVPQMESVAKSDAHDARKLVLKNDFVINSRSDRKMSSGVSNYDGSVSLINIVLQSKGAIVPAYSHYLFKNVGFAEEFYKWGHGIVADLWTTRWDEMKKISIPLPSIEEQEKIAGYLKTTIIKIDELISIQEKQIKLLEEEKISFITKIIEEGLNNELEQSLISTVSKKPLHWKTTKLLNLLEMKVTDGPHETPELYPEGIPFVSAEAIKNWTIDFDYIRGFISKEFYDYCCLKYIPRKNDIYVVKSGASTGKLGIVNTDRVFTIWSPLAVVRVDDRKAYYKFVFYALYSRGFQQQIQLGWSFGTQQNLGMRTLETLKIQYPESLEEQHRIADFIDVKVSSIDRLIQIKKEKIEKLQEYKKSLIYEYVTGKKEV